MDFLTELFTTDAAVIAANKAEAARIAHIEATDRADNAARLAAMAAEKIAHRCPKCMGAGRLPQFAHRKGGECFTCGGSGVFAGYTA